MIGDIDILGVFLPTLLALMALTYLLYFGLTRVLSYLHFYRLVWHRALFNVALYTLLLGAVESFCRYLML